MRQSILFYVSGHGYGHARRMTQVIRGLLAINPTCRVHIRSAAPARIFAPLPAEFIETCNIDAGVVEKDALTIDRQASLDRLRQFMADRERIIAREVAVVQRLKPDLIVADIPFLAGDVAASANVSCVGISNFTWDWIYQNLFGDDPEYAIFARSIADSYAKMSALLSLPFGRTCPAISRRIDVPLIALRSDRDTGEILYRLGVSTADTRPRVLIGTRGAIDPGILLRAAADAPEFIILCPNESADSLPPNGISVRLDADLDFSDVLKISQVVVSKLGYGMLSECISSQTRLVWPPRLGFAEDEVAAREAPEFVPMLPMTTEAYRSGEWGAFLRQAIALPAATGSIRTDGARVCAAWIASNL